jgi:hypothetical protein
MMRFARQAYGPGILNEAWDEFTLWEEEEEDPRFDPSSVHLQVFVPWFLHGWAPDPAETDVADVSLHDVNPTRAFLDRRGRRLEPLKRRYLEACLEAHFSFHEIVDVDPGRGFRSRDVLTGRELEVLERKASLTMEPADIFFGQLVTIDGINIMEACSPYMFPPSDKLDLIDLRSRMAAGPPPLDGDALAEWDIEIREVYLGLSDRLLNPPPLRVENTDGEAVAFHRVSFAVPSPDEAFRALKHLALDDTEAELLDSAEFDAEGRMLSVSFVWKVAANAVHPGWETTVLGHLEIEGETLVASVNSAERAERLRRLVAAACPDARHLGTEIESAEDAMARTEDRVGVAPAADPAVSDPAVRAHVAGIIARHYQEWTRSPVPALGGLTPLEAVRDRDGREKVEVLVNQFERRGATMDPPMDEAVIRRLREDLGLSEPSSQAGGEDR